MEFGTVLIVDDNFMVRELVENMLISGTVNCGQVLYCSNGEEGLECIKENDVDLLIVDHNMPGMTGEELVAYVRRNPKTAATQILFMTGEQDLALVTRMVYRGCQVLHKPVRSSDFLRCLQEFS